MNKKYLLMILGIFCISLFTGCNNHTDSYTLYRNSPLDPNMVIKIATFNSQEKSYGAESSESYNRYNCNLAAKLFQSQPNVVTRFWCEKGD